MKLSSTNCLLNVKFWKQKERKQFTEQDIQIHACEQTHLDPILLDSFNNLFHLFKKLFSVPWRLHGSEKMNITL